MLMGGQQVLSVKGARSGKERWDPVLVFRKCVICRLGDSGKLLVISATQCLGIWREELSSLLCGTQGVPME